MKTVCIYDNHTEPNIFIKNIIGQKKFGEVILKRQKVKEKFWTFIKKQKVIDEILEWDYDWQMEALIGKLKQFNSDTHIVHIFSNFIVQNETNAGLLLKKLPYIAENYVCFSGNAPALFMLDNIPLYCQILERHSNILQNEELYVAFSSDIEFKRINSTAFFNLGIYSNFMQYISGGFDTRFFNSVKGDEFTVIKSSTDKKKIKAEYQFYQLLPDYMKTWFVMPYDYQETTKEASYKMERLHITDLAIRWVHGAITLDELKKLLDKAFYFIQTREKKPISQEDYVKLEHKLYLDKLEQRIKAFKRHEKYSFFEMFVGMGTKFSGIDDILENYKQMFYKITGSLNMQYFSVIGHGDLCFSNMLFNKEADLLKLIDPKGAVEEDELWTNPYYDLAKLSHSICGRYDFFNNGLYHISLGSDLKFKLDIDFDNIEYTNKFRDYVENNGFSYEAVRLYEVSLFLSMLPLHMDNPQKVFGFILNAINIMGELEGCLRD